MIQREKSKAAAHRCPSAPCAEMTLHILVYILQTLKNTYMDAAFAKLTVKSINGAKVRKGWPPLRCAGKWEEAEHRPIPFPQLFAQPLLGDAKTRQSSIS